MFIYIVFVSSFRSIGPENPLVEWSINIFYFILLYFILLYFTILYCIIFYFYLFLFIIYFFIILLNFNWFYLILLFCWFCLGLVRFRPLHSMLVLFCFVSFHFVLFSLILLQLCRFSCEHRNAQNLFSKQKTTLNTNNLASISKYVINIGTNWFEWPYKWGKIIED